jgi:hypothetical protein
VKGLVLEISVSLELDFLVSVISVSWGDEENGEVKEPFENDFRVVDHFIIESLLVS